MCGNKLIYVYYCVWHKIKKFFKNKLLTLIMGGVEFMYVKIFR